MPNDTVDNILGLPNTPQPRPYPEQAAGHPDELEQIVRYPAPKDGVLPPVDHLTEIETLARQSQFTSPSGAETLCQRILIHIQALRDPEAYDKAEAEKRAADDKENARQAKITAERKATYQVPEHHRGAQGTAQPDQRLP